MNVEALRKTVESLEKALNESPEDIDLLTSLAGAHYRLGWFNGDLRRICERVLSEAPENPLLQESLSIIDLMDQVADFIADSALRRSVGPAGLNQIKETLNRILDEHPHSADLHRALADLMIITNDPDAAIEHFEEAVRCGLSDPSLIMTAFQTLKSTRGFSPKALLFFAGLMDELDQPERAMALYQDLLDRDDLDAPIAERLLGLYREKMGQDLERLEPLRLAKICLILDRIDDAMAAIQLADPKEDGSHGVILRIADHLMERQRQHEVFDLLSLLPRDESVKRRFGLLADFFEAQGDYEQSARILRYLNSEETAAEPIRISIEAQTQAELARLNIRRKRYGKAIDNIERVLSAKTDLCASVIPLLEQSLQKSNSPNPDALASIARILIEQHQQEWARQCLQKAVLVSPQHEDALALLAQILEKDIKADEDDWQKRMQFAQALLRLGRAVDALRNFDKLSGKAEYAESAQRGIANAAAAMGDFPRAIGIWNDLAPQAEDSDDLLDLVGKCRSAMEFRYAFKALELLDRIYPGSPSMAVLRGEIEQDIQNPEMQYRDPKMIQLIGDHAIGKYRFEGIMGSSPIGILVKALDIQQQKHMAIRVFADNLELMKCLMERPIPNKREGYDYDFRIWENSDKDHSPWAARVWIDGESLRGVLSETPEEKRLGFALRAAKGIAARLMEMHKHFAHGNLEPGNIIICPDGEYRLPNREWDPRVRCLTYVSPSCCLYMAPEMFSDLPATRAADLYSLATIIYEIAVGSPPFVSGNIMEQHLSAPPISPRELNPKIPVALSEVILRNLAKNPENRQSAADFYRELEMIPEIDG